MTSVKTSSSSRSSQSFRDDEVHTPVLVGLLFRRLGEAVHTRDWDGLRQSHFRVLACVPPEGASVTEVAERVGVTKQGCGQLVAPLVASGHLSLAASPGDGRVRLVRRTPAGDRLYAEVRAHVADIEVGWAEQVGQERYDAFRTVLAELALEPRGGVQGASRGAAQTSER